MVFINSWVSLCPAVWREKERERERDGAREGRREEKRKVDKQRGRERERRREWWRERYLLLNILHVHLLLMFCKQLIIISVGFQLFICFLLIISANHFSGISLHV